MAIDTNKLQQQAADLSSQLWAIANDLRGGMDANEFRNYILGTIFYRYLSERTEMYMADILKEGHEKMLYSVNTGFLPDLTAVTAEQDAMRSVLNEYLTDQMLYSGRMTSAEIDTAVAEFVGKLNAAGADRIRAEVQRQLDEWHAER